MHQFLDERLRTLQATEDALLDMVEKSGAESVTAANVTTAVSRAHPGLAPEAVAEMVSLVFHSTDGQAGSPSAIAAGSGKSKGGKKESVGLQDALRRLRAGPLGPSEAELAAEALEAASVSPGKTAKKSSGKGKGKK